MSMTERIEHIRKQARAVLDEVPAVREPLLQQLEATYRSGALDAKTKRLMALCAALTHGCTGCILGQTDHALQQGATPAEIMETCALAISIGGTLAWSQTYKVMAYLEENDLLK